MNVRTLCLAILNFADATGYEIRKLSTDGKFSHFVDASYGSIYPALTRLESEGLVTFRTETIPGKPNRKIYTITDKGREEFFSSLTEPPAKDIYRSEFLLVAMCAEYLPKSVVKAAIATRVEQLTDEIHMLEGFVDDPEGTGCFHWAANYGLDCMSNSLRYLNEKKEEIEGLAGSKMINKAEAAE